MLDSPSIATALLQCNRLKCDSPKLEAELLLSEVLGRDRAFLSAWPDFQLDEEEFKRYQALLERRCQGEPIAYLLGHRAFWTFDLKVSPDTLIPRADTEVLVEYALGLELPSKAKVLDLGTGTGAIALALASERRAWQVTASDCFSNVLSIAQENVERLALENVDFIGSHWFDSIPKMLFHLIVSNPPYIDKNDVHLQQGDLRFEPSAALVSENKGLADIEHIIIGSHAYLHQQAWLMIEHGFEQGLKVRELMSSAGFVQVQTVKDLGRNERVTFGQR